MAHEQREPAARRTAARAHTSPHAPSLRRIVICAGWAVLCAACSARAPQAPHADSPRLAARRVTGARCEGLVAPINDGYGADGPFKVEIHRIESPSTVLAPTVFLPAGARFPRPVIFLLHGYGPNYWPAYRDLIDHLVSRGLIVVYGTYPARGVSHTGRYEALWDSFLAAVAPLRARMDLTRVGFIGHSYGAGATPALAHKAVAGQGWGRQGAFTFILAPWYALEVSDVELPPLPEHMLQVIETYDRDAINDHRMAIDLFNHSAVPGGQYFFLIRSMTVGGCELTADHSTPAQNPSLRLKQYAVFKPLDALIEAAFDGSAPARAALTAMGRASAQEAYQPLVLLSTPTPDAPQSRYLFRWSAWINPRRAGEPW